MSDTRHRSAMAERAARAGGAVARDDFREQLSVETKTDKNDLVTAADRDAQQQVVHTIVEEFPNEPFLCEEDLAITGRTDDQSAGPAVGPAVDAVPEMGPCWVVDPIDGTANFARGFRLWATSVAAVDDGATVAAATYLPSTQDIYTAGPDSATRNGASLATSDRTDPETFAVGLVARWSREHSDRLGRLAGDVNEHFGDSRRLGSFQTTLAMVASGELDAAVTTEPTTAWDTLAGVKLVAAAGGIVTDPDGEPWSQTTDGLVASNGQAHETLVDVVQATLEQS